MKINISADTRDGYENILQKGDICNLDWLLKDNSAEEILSNDILTKIPANELNSTVSGWINKLKVGGIIKIGFIDANILLSLYTNGQLAINEINNIIYQNKNLLEKQTVLDIIKSCKIKLVSCRFDGFNTFLCAEKI